MAGYIHACQCHYIIYIFIHTKCSNKTKQKISDSKDVLSVSCCCNVCLFVCLLLLLLLLLFVRCFCTLLFSFVFERKTVWAEGTTDT